MQHDDYRLLASVRILAYLYEKACADLGLKAERIGNRIWLFNGITDEQNVELGKIYVKYILTCSSSTLEKVLEAHDTGYCKRRENTLSAIRAELWERVLYEEMQQASKIQGEKQTEA